MTLSKHASRSGLFEILKLLYCAGGFVGWLVGQWTVIFVPLHFKTKMTKMRFQIKPHIFFLFWMTVFSDIWTVNLWYSRFLGFQKLRPKVVFIETRGIRWLRRPSASTANETPGLNETTLGLNFETPKNVKPQIYCPNLTEYRNTK